MLDRKHTKSGRPDERRMPRDLDAAIASYLLIHRPVLKAVARRKSDAMSDIGHLLANGEDAALSSAETLDAAAGPLWLSSNSGHRMSYSSVELAITATHAPGAWRGSQPTSVSGLRSFRNLYFRRRQTRTSPAPSCNIPTEG